MTVLGVHHQPLRLLLPVAALMIVGAACTSNAEVALSESTPAVAPATTDAATTAQSAEQAAPSGRTIPAGFSEQRADSFSVAVPTDWTTLTDVADLDELIDLDSTGDFPAAAVEGYRSVLANGDGLVALGAGGDNFNAFRQPGTAADLGDPESVGVEVARQFETFAQNVTITATPRFLGDLAGTMTSGQYSLNGQTFHLYQFATAHEDHVYFLTVTLLTGPDQQLADQILGSIAFE